MPGPPPKRPEDRRRRNATVPMTQLPSEGRRGSPPTWPFADPGGRELHWWRKLWKSPQAVAWERHQLLTSVARYCVVLCQFEGGRLSPQVLSECRQLEDRLGLNPMAMLRLRWEVAADELGAQRQAPAIAAATRRRRPEPVDPGEPGALAGP